MLPTVSLLCVINSRDDDDEGDEGDDAAHRARWIRLSFLKRVVSHNNTELNHRVLMFDNW